MKRHEKYCRSSFKNDLLQLTSKPKHSIVGKSIKILIDRSTKTLYENRGSCYCNIICDFIINIILESFAQTKLKLLVNAYICSRDRLSCTRYRYNFKNI